MEQLTVTILGREYRVACRPEERDELLACAQYVDRKMVAVRDGGKVLDQTASRCWWRCKSPRSCSARAARGVPIADLRRRLRELNDLATDMLAPQEKAILNGLFPCRGRPAARRN